MTCPANKAIKNTCYFLKFEKCTSKKINIPFFFFYYTKRVKDENDK